ncbi:MAG: rsmH [Chlamydiia bacterium]|nr:rsmH [Chlamydiia bacterium]
MQLQASHISVMQEECCSFFREKQLLTFVDGTLGAAGHSSAILQEHPEMTLLIGIDQDPLALTMAKERLKNDLNRVRFVHGNFENLKKYIDHPVDGILLDLGVSSMQLNIDERGFSFMRDGPLDMRMNTEGDLTAEDIVNSWREEELATIFRDLGEERKWRQVAKAICQARRKTRITTTLQLAEIISSVIPRYGKLHPATLVFQGLRLAVNRELEVLKKVLPEAIDLLAPGGRLGVISFHSLEDRIVKECFRHHPDIAILTKKPLVPSREECRKNPRSRSAKVRFCEKLKKNTD